MDNVINEQKPATHQKHLGDKGFILLIALLSAFAPISTDMYLPALPGMSDYFHVSGDLTNLTLFVFFIFFSLGMLFWGPLSDKFGRRPVLLTGLALFIVSSAMCAISWDIWLLIVMRIIQAIGGSAAIAVATAMVKDVYEGKRQELVLSVVQSMIMIAPAVAPLLGAILLAYTSWRGIFWALTLIGVISMIGGLLLEETITTRFTGTLIQSIRRLGAVIKNPGFTSLLIIFSVVMMAMLGFVAASSYIYEEGFGLSEQWYSVYFAINAVGLIAGSFLYLWLCKYFRRTSIITSCFVFMIAGGVLVCLFGRLGPLVFSAVLLPASVMGSCIRTPGTFLVLEQQKHDTGSVAALINSVGLIFGTAGILVVSFDTSSVFLLGAINVIVGLFCLAGWLIIGRLKLARIND